MADEWTNCDWYLGKIKLEGKIMSIQNGLRRKLKDKCKKVWNLYEEKCKNFSLIWSDEWLIGGFKKEESFVDEPRQSLNWDEAMAKSFERR